MSTRRAPSSVITTLSLTTNAANTLTMISAAQVMTRAVISRPCATDAGRGDRPGIPARRPGERAHRHGGPVRPTAAPWTAHAPVHYAVRV